jgi:hypothetical protein
MRGGGGIFQGVREVVKIMIVARKPSLMIYRFRSPSIAQHRSVKSDRVQVTIKSVTGTTSVVNADAPTVQAFSGLSGLT